MNQCSPKPGKSCENCYTPEPICTKDVKLPVSLENLEEQLAANTHNIWAAERIKNGWRYGPNYNKDEKTNPLLVPYECLPESEKNFDRIITSELLKTILKLGFAIIPTSE